MQILRTACQVKPGFDFEELFPFFDFGGINSQKEVFHYLAKVKKVRVSIDDKWRSGTTVSYIADIAKALYTVD